MELINGFVVKGFPAYMDQLRKNGVHSYFIGVKQTQVRNMLRMLIFLNSWLKLTGKISEEIILDIRLED